MWRGELSQKGCAQTRSFASTTQARCDMLCPSAAPFRFPGLGEKQRPARSMRTVRQGTVDVCAPSCAQTSLGVRECYAPLAGVRVQSSVRPIALSAASAQVPNRAKSSADAGPCLAVCSTHRCVPSRRRTPANIAPLQPHSLGQGRFWGLLDPGMPRLEPPGCHGLSKASIPSLLPPPASASSSGSAFGSREQSPCSHFSRTVIRP